MVPRSPSAGAADEGFEVGGVAMNPHGFARKLAKGNRKSVSVKTGCWDINCNGFAMLIETKLPTGNK